MGHSNAKQLGQILKLTISLVGQLLAKRFEFVFYHDYMLRYQQKIKVIKLILLISQQGSKLGIYKLYTKMSVLLETHGIGINFPKRCGLP